MHFYEWPDLFFPLSQYELLKLDHYLLIPRIWLILWEFEIRFEDIHLCLTSHSQFSTSNSRYLIHCLGPVMWLISFLLCPFPTDTEREIQKSSMAQASQEQGAVGIADPDEDSPNMIAYRKVLLHCLYIWCALDSPFLKSCQQVNA